MKWMIYKRYEKGRYNIYWGKKKILTYSANNYSKYAKKQPEKNDTSLLVYTYANKNYYEFAILYPIWVLQNNPQTRIEIAIENFKDFYKLYGHLIEFYEQKYPTQVIYTQIDKRFKKASPGAIRFISQPINKAKYVYIGDVDILVLQNIEKLHLVNILKNNLDFSNIKRHGLDKLSGLHFIEYDKMYPVNTKGVDIIKDNDENILYKLMLNKKYKIPDETKNTFRPLCGIHISYFSRPPLKTITSDDALTSFPCWYDTNTYGDFEEYMRLRNSDCIKDFYAQIKETDITLRRLVQIIDIFVFYITEHKNLLK